MKSTSNAKTLNILGHFYLRNWITNTALLNGPNKGPQQRSSHTTYNGRQKVRYLEPQVSVDLCSLSVQSRYEVPTCTCNEPHLCTVLVHLWLAYSFYSHVVVQARWTIDIGLDSSVVEHLTSDAGSWV